MTIILRGKCTGHNFRTCRKKKVCMMKQCTNVIMPGHTYVALEFMRTQHDTWDIAQEQPDAIHERAYYNICLTCAEYDPQTLQPIGADADRQTPRFSIREMATRGKATP